MRYFEDDIMANEQLKIMVTDIRYGESGECGTRSLISEIDCLLMVNNSSLLPKS